MNWIGDFEKNTQKMREGFFGACRMLGKFCHLLFFQKLLKRLPRLCNAVAKAVGGFIEEYYI